MPKVTYLGVYNMKHSNNPTGTEYMFSSKKPTEVKPEDARYYAKEEASGAPWKVEGLVLQIENVAEAVKEVIHTKPKKYGGKK